MKKRNNLLLIPLFIFVAIFLYGAINLVIPHKPSDFIFHSIRETRASSMLRSEVEFSFVLENRTEQKYEDIEASIYYTIDYEDKNETLGLTEKFTISVINVGENIIHFTHDNKISSHISLGTVRSVSLTINGEKVKAEYVGLLGEGILKYIIPTALGAIAAIIFLIKWLKSDGTKKTLYQEAKERKQRLASGEVVCPYCNTAYNLNENNKCPQCNGVPNIQE